MSKARRIDGVDLSHFQANTKIIWPEAKRAGVKFVYHKATEGHDWVDPSYDARRQECAAERVPFGAYHFAHPSLDPNSARGQAKFFLSHAKPAEGDMIPVLDLEVNEHHMSEDELSRWVAEWFSVVFRSLGHERGFLYTNMPITHRPKGVYLWSPRYNDDNRLPLVHRPFRSWSLWQFTDGKHGNPSAVPGIGRVDANTFHHQVGWHRFLLPVVHTKPVPHRKPVVTPIDKAVAIAKSQIGYHEGRSNGHWNNVQKFSTQVPTLGWSQGQPWCCTFVSWVAFKSGLAAYYPCTASCKTAMATWQSWGQWHDYPAIGAQVIYGGGEHTGFVVGYDDTFVYVMEGNTNTNGSAEGDGCYLKKRLRRDPYVTGYGYPEIPGVRLHSADPNYKRSN